MSVQQLLRAVGYGFLAIITIVLSISFIFSVILRFSSLTEGSIRWLIVGSSFIAIFIGGIIAGGRGKERGWIIGALTGLLYTIFVFFVQFLGYSMTFDSSQMLFHFGYMGTAVLGGVIGVNLSSK
ncbi:TIGR04086 family membrane protein [Bacillus taeanensis]|uniref:TIGR04086 family membrane protein n=1 Tax=Bacillus taeanensis TaxID=273032 RepID=A0A366Y201_9BACI|nr:TIGR04086 family membrane protein [Bacillus taeanensis]RBW70424.1 TIGR04086 family membrane protein [Bacillus taeanensis]